MHIEGISHSLLSMDPALPVVLGGASAVLLLIAIWLAVPWLAAMFGQQRLVSQLKQFEKNGATLLNSILLPDKKGDTIHISHLLITNQSISVIDRIGYSGEISGSLRDALWTQSSKRGQNRFPNPVRNHDTARKTLEHILGTQMRVRTATVFTSGKLHVAESDYVMPLKDFSRISKQLEQEKASGPKQVWASNLLRNITIKDEEAQQSILSASNAMQGDPARLKVAGYLLIGSAVVMLCAITLAGGRMAASLGII